MDRKFTDGIHTSQYDWGGWESRENNIVAGTVRVIGRKLCYCMRVDTKWFTKNVCHWSIIEPGDAMNILTIDCRGKDERKGHVASYDLINAGKFVTAEAVTDALQALRLEFSGTLEIYKKMTEPKGPSVPKEKNNK